MIIELLVHKGMWLFMCKTDNLRRKMTVKNYNLSMENKTQNIQFMDLF